MKLLVASIDRKLGCRWHWSTRAQQRREKILVQVDRKQVPCEGTWFPPWYDVMGRQISTRDGRRHERAARLKADRAACHWPTGGRKLETDRAQGARARGPRPLWFGGDLGALASGGRRGRAWMVVDEVLAAGHHWKRQGGHLGSFQGSRVASGNLARAQPASVK